MVHGKAINATKTWKDFPPSWDREKCFKVALSEHPTLGQGTRVMGTGQKGAGSDFQVSSALQFFFFFFWSTFQTHLLVGISNTGCKNYKLSIDGAGSKSKVTALVTVLHSSASNLPRFLQRQPKLQVSRNRSVTQLVVVVLSKALQLAEQRLVAPSLQHGGGLQRKTLDKV